MTQRENFRKAHQTQRVQEGDQPPPVDGDTLLKDSSIVDVEASLAPWDRRVQVLMLREWSRRASACDAISFFCDVAASQTRIDAKRSSRPSSPAYSAAVRGLCPQTEQTSHFSQQQYSLCAKMVTPTCACWCVRRWDLYRGWQIQVC